MFLRSNGRFMDGNPNHNVRDRRGRNGQVVIEKQTRTLWGTPFGKWERDTSKANHKRARRYAKRNG